MNAILPALTSAPITPLKIALLGYRSHPHVGGQGIYLKHLSAALLALGHQVDVISGPPYPELVPGVKLIKLPSLNLYEHPGHHILALRPKHLRSWADLSEWWAMATGAFGEPYSFGRRVLHYIKRHGHHYDVIHDNQSLSYGLLQLQQLGFPVVATIHHPITRDRDIAVANAKNALHQSGAKRWYSFVKMQTEVVQKLKHLVTVSEFSKLDICAEFQCLPENITVIKNGVDTSQFKPLPDTPKIPGRMITTASSDQPLKGFGVLLNALSSLRLKIPNAHLVVVGKLKPKGASQALLNRLNLQAAVTFISGLSNEALNQEYAKAEVAVCPSLYEGFGLPAAEAMAAGVPVVSSNGGALPEVIGEAGIMVAAGDSLALCEALVKVLQNPTLQQQLRKQGLERILTGFCWHHAAKSLSHFYQQTFVPAANAND